MLFRDMETVDILRSELAPPTPFPRDICVVEEEATPVAVLPNVDDKLDAVGAALETICA